MAPSRRASRSRDGTWGAPAPEWDTTSSARGESQRAPSREPRAGGAGSASGGGGGVACAAAWGAVEAEGARAPPPERVVVPISAQRTVCVPWHRSASVHRFPRQ